MKLRYLLITVVCVLFLCVISKEADANSYDSWRYDFMPGSSTEVYISGYNPSDDAVPIKLIVPESFNGYTVTGIYYYALDKEGITHLVLPSSFHTIVDYNGQTMLSKCLSLPDSLQQLEVAEGNTVFYAHDNALYRGNTLIQVAPASECETVHILDGTVAIWAGAFGDSQHLKNLDIPATVTDLELVPDSERYYFSRYFPKSLESFTVEKDNPVYQSEDGLLYRGNALDCCPSSKAEELLKIREGTEIIEHYAFYDCDLIRSIRLPSSVREIQSIAFFGCKILENISSLSNVSQIEESAICYCWRLHSLGWDSDNESYQMIDGALIDRKTQTLITMIDDAERLSVKIPDGVLRIGSDALTCLGKMERIDLPVSLTEIGDSAFCYTDLREAVLPAHVNNMGTEVFWGCSELETVILPKDLQTLPDYTFYKCEKLKNIQLPDQLTYIGVSVFDDCASLTSIVIPDSVTFIGRDAFSGCTALNNITLSSQLPQIGDCTFQDCTSLISIEIPDSVTIIDWRAFSGCSSLKSIKLPNNLTELGNSCFEGCTSLTSVTIPGGVKNLRAYDLFKNCSALNTVKFQEGIETCSNDIFTGCTAMKYLLLPKSFTGISSYFSGNPFPDCPKLTAVVYIGSSAEQYYKKYGIPIKYHFEGLWKASAPQEAAAILGISSATEIYLTISSDLLTVLYFDGGQPQLETFNCSWNSTRVLLEEGYMNYSFEDYRMTLETLNGALHLERQEDI